MADGSVVLLTGATGFLGAQIARRLIADPGCTVLALVRAPDAESAARRLEWAWWDWPELEGAIGDRVQPIAGDVRQENLGLQTPLRERITHIIHTAAELRLEAPIEELRRTNVAGTQHVLDVARAAPGLERLAYVSTAYVCGKRRGPIAEQSFTDRYGFSTGYEQSKYEAEALIRAADLPFSIFRPGMIVGDSKTGAIKTFNTVYVPLHLFLTGKLPVVPTSRAQRLNIVPVDYVADAIAGLAFDRRAAGSTFHLVPPYAKLPTAGELLDFVRGWASETLDLQLPPTVFINVPVPALPGMPQALRILKPYLREDQQFRRDNVDALLGPDAPDWHAYAPHLLEYAVAHTFLNRSERSVYEQLVYRLARKRWPVTYYNVTAAGISRREGPELKEDISQAAARLQALGVKPGDRVALVGVNSTRYLALDVAIGLLKAVSVPLYQTSPPVEIAALVKASGARLLLIDVPHLSSDDLPADIQVVRFTDIATSQCSPPNICNGSPRDVATMRFTSGTTGPPKAAVFDQASLRWMAETLAGLVPWRARHHAARYLSFLPMNHVVEGMLATYAPYYLPARLDIYFLDDFHRLADALPVASPTVFFSVPRVYEKIWSGLQDSAIGQRYLHAQAGLWKESLRRVLQRAVLRRSGLNRCALLIVGSAPVGEALLRSFRELGIEIHSAYGLTEAPLVTLNRTGANRLGTVGEALPETDVAIAEDGEILVRGPQVMRCYAGVENQPFEDGWLQTGDLGRLTPEGSLVIDGRKKDLIATAYGKKIAPDRVEALLRQIPGVHEALLIGEARPYCSALLWTTDGTGCSELSIGIERVNAQLSHAEQVKRWTVLVDDLSIQRGDLTPGLKLKRAAVSTRFAAAIEHMYAEALVT